MSEIENAQPQFSCQLRHTEYRKALKVAFKGIHLL